MKKAWKRLASLFLVLAMVGLLIPETAYASETTESAQTSTAKDTDGGEDTQEDEDCEDETVTYVAESTVNEDGEVISVSTYTIEGDETEDADADDTTDSDADSSTDADTDAGSDSDTDSDTDSTADSDTGTDTGSDDTADSNDSADDSDSTDTDTDDTDDTDDTGSTDTDTDDNDTDDDDTDDDTEDVITSKTTTSSETQTTYKLTVKASTASFTSIDGLKKIAISVPKLTTTKKKVTTTTTKYYNSAGKVTDTETSTSTKTISTKTSTYGLTVKLHVRKNGWVKASKNDAGTYYTYTLKKSQVSSGEYFQAIIITPSDKLKSAMKTAGYTFCYKAKTEYWTLGWAKAGQTAGTVGNNNPMTGLTLKVVTTSAAKKLDTTDRYISTTRVYYRTRATGASSWNAQKKSGATSGTTSSTGSLGSLKASVKSSNSSFSYSGSIKYSIRTTISDSSSNWSSYKSNGSIAGSKNSAIQAIKIKLTGEKAEQYDIYYRVYVGNYGWLDWAKNGQKAGTKGIGITISAIQIKLVPKGADAPGDTSDHYISSISGDSTLDGYLTKIYKKKGTNLYTLFKYVASYTYYRTYDTPSGSWKTWSITYAKEMYAHQYGNCYRYAALFCWLARGLGYNAKVVTGYVPSRSKGWAPHGWCVITKNGTQYVCDPDLYKSYPTLNWYMVTYSRTPVTYKR